jgi:methionyl-tRNA formyltransferase
MNIVLVTHDSIFGRYLASTLWDAGHLSRVLVETHKAPASFYWRKLRRVGPINVGFQYWLNRWFAREGATVLPHREFPTHERIESINTVRFTNDEIVLGFGTSYVSPRTLSAAPNGILNLHTGVLPQYRGVKSEFWALYNRDPAGLGWTVHYMTPRLDAGDIVLCGTVARQNESAGAMRGHVVQAAAAALLPFLAAVRRGEPINPRPQDESVSRYYSTPTWRDWRRV